MFKRISKSTIFIQIIITSLAFALLWFSAFINPKLPVQTLNQGPLYSVFAGIITSPVLSVILASFFVLIQAFLLNFIFQQLKLISNSNFLPSLFTVIFYSWNSSLLTINPILVSGLFTILAFYFLLYLYEGSDTDSKILNISLLFSIASLFYLPFIYLIFPIYSSLIIVRINSLRKYIIAFIGFIIPYLYYFSFLFITDNLSQVNDLLDVVWDFNLLSSLKTNNIIPVISFLILIVFSMFMLLNKVGDKVIRIQKKTKIYINYVIISFVFIIITKSNINDIIFINIFSIVFFICLLIDVIKKSFYYELFAFIMILLILVNRFI